MATKHPSPTTDPTSPGPTQQPLRQRRRRRPPASALGSTPTAPSSRSSAMKPTTKSVRSNALSTDLDQQVGGQESSGSVSPYAGTCKSKTSSDVKYPANEINNDLMLQPRYQGVSRPEVVSFSEFLRIAASERQPRRQPNGALLQDDRNSNKADKVNSANCPLTTGTAAVSDLQYDSDDVKSPSVCSLEIPSPSVEEPKGDVLVKSSPEKVDAEKLHAVNSTPDAALTHDIIIWEGTIQLSVSSRTDVVAIFKSGEKPSTNDWPHFLEIKQTMSLGVFEYLLELLRKSRKYTIMVTELRWKEGSTESGRHHLLKTIESYTADEGVGLVKPTKEVELFLCPCQGKAAQILAEHHLLKEPSGSLTTLLATSIIGVVVWQRPHISSRVPRQAATCPSLPMVSKPSSPSSNRPYHENADVPPGIGSGAIWDGNDDVPQYRLVRASNSDAYGYRSHQHVVHTCVLTEEDRARELVRRYGGYNIPAEADPYSQGNPQQARIPCLRDPYQHHQQQLQYHSMLQYHMSQSTLPQASAQHHQHIAMPVTQTYGQQSHLGVLDDGSRQYYRSGAGNQAWWYQR